VQHGRQEEQLGSVPVLLNDSIGMAKMGTERLRSLHGSPAN
jgi:hypothetical protein